MNQNFLVQGEVLRALRKLPGVRVIALNIVSHPNVDQAAYTVTILRREKCTVVFTINEWGIDCEGVVNEYIDKSGIIHVNWCVDDPFYEEIIAKKKFRPISKRVDFVSDRDYLVRMKKCGYNAEFLPLATDPSLFYPVLTSIDKSFVFVGNSYLAQVDKFVEEIDSAVQPVIPFLASLLIKYKKNCMSIDIDKEITGYVSKLSFSDRVSIDKLIFVSKHIIGYLYRKDIVGFCASHFEEFQLFGDEGWKEIIPRLHAGKVWYGDELRNLYNTVKVNLDCNRVVIRDGFTQRTFDVLGCNKFLITGEKPVIKEMFQTEENKQEIVTFRNNQELIDKVKFYLVNDKERIEIAQRGYYRVINEHTYDHRVQQLFRHISQLLN